MYAAIDMDRMVFTHVHPERSVLSRLAHMELPHSSVKIIPLDHPRALLALTDLELKLLWRNTTGSELGGYLRDSHLRHCIALLTVVAENPCTVNPQELIAQCDAVSEQDTSVYRYTPGARFPVAAPAYIAPPVTVPPPPPFSQKQVDVLLEEVASDVLAGLQAAAAADAAARRVASPSTSSPSSGPRSPAGSVSPLVHEVADRMWEAAGSPRDPSTVLKLRKSIMDELEAKHGVKRTTSSTTLGAWQKARLKD